MDEKTYQEQVDNIRKDNPFITHTQIAYEIILDNILKNIFLEGEKINQEILSQLLEMSRTPIREALAKLESEGVVVSRDRRYYVYEANVKDYVNFYEFRIRIESFAAYLAARLASDEQLEELKQVLKMYIEAGNSRDFKRMCQLDSKFHEIIVVASQNQYIINSYRQIDIKKRFYMKNIGVSTSYTASMQKKHIDIYNAIRNRDEKLAEESMKSHFSFYIYRLSEI